MKHRGGPRARLVVLTACTLAVWLCAPAVSQADTVLGGIGPAGASRTYCYTGGQLLVQSGTKASEYTVPRAGVITQWTTLAGTANGQQMTFKVFRRNSSSSWTVVGTNGPRSLPRNSADSFTVRIPVSAGDVLGLHIPALGGVETHCVLDTTDSFDAIQRTFANTDPGLNQANAFRAPEQNLRLNLQARLEADADRDGFGDESQDRCPASPTAQFPPCPKPPVAGRPPVARITPAPMTGSTGGTAAPVLSSLRLSRTTFAAAKSGSAVASAKRSKAKVGAKVSFTLSKASKVKFTAERSTHGRKVDGDCVKAKRSNRKKRPCTLYVAVKGSFSVAGEAGDNDFTFRARIGGKSLGPGNYRLAAKATDASKRASTSKRKGFKVIR